MIYTWNIWVLYIHTYIFGSFYIVYITSVFVSSLSICVLYICIIYLEILYAYLSVCLTGFPSFWTVLQVLWVCPGSHDDSFLGMHLVLCVHMHCLCFLADTKALIKLFCPVVTVAGFSESSATGPLWASAITDFYHPFLYKLLWCI
jgi:hypothetical protein